MTESTSSDAAAAATPAEPQPRSRWSATRQQVQRVWALTRPYFSSEDRWKALGLLLTIVALNLGTVYLNVLLNDWRRVFYDALQQKNAAVFWEQLWRFLYLAMAFVVASVYTFYLTQVLELRWRNWMTRQYLDQWLAQHNFYRLELHRYLGATGARQDNPDQRIQEDIGQFTGLTLGLTMGLLNSVVSLFSFVGILWSLSGAFAMHLAGSEYVVPGFMVWVAVLYCAAGSVATHFIGRPQIALNFRQQQVEADFRHRMVRVREYSESIALERGEQVERRHLGEKFQRVFGNQWALIQAQKRLIWFTALFGQASSVFPMLIAAPRYFSGAIALGELMQIASAFGEVQGALNWFVDNYQSLAGWRATTDRLTGFAAVLRLPAPAASVPTASASEGARCSQLDIDLPDGRPLLHGVDVAVRSGDRVLIGGPSGSGKSTLLRVLAGIWPYARGTVACAPDAVFLPQRPYFPDGPLRDALAYPQAASQYSDAELQQALRTAELPALCERLDESAAWSQTLSGGEQQRLALARVFLRQPRWIFADEATSALDEHNEHLLYQQLCSLVVARDGALVSVAHRPGLAAFHRQRWQVQAQGAGDTGGLRLSENAS